MFHRKRLSKMFLALSVILIIMFGASSPIIASNLLGIVTQNDDQFISAYNNLIDRFIAEAEVLETNPDISGWGYAGWGNDDFTDAYWYDVHSDVPCYNDDEFPSSLHDLDDDIGLIILHSRRATSGPNPHPDDPHPFVYEYGNRKWLFAHNGSLGDEPVNQNEMDNGWWPDVRALIHDVYWEGLDVFSEENCPYRGTADDWDDDAIDSQIFSMLLVQNVITANAHAQSLDWAIKITMQQLEDALNATPYSENWTSLNFLWSNNGNHIYAVRNNRFQNDDNHTLWTLHSEYDGYTEAWAVISTDDNPHQPGNIWDLDDDYWPYNEYEELEDTIDGVYVILTPDSDPGEGLSDQLSLEYTGEEDNGRFIENYDAIVMATARGGQGDPGIGYGPKGTFAVVCESDDEIIGSNLDQMGMWEYHGHTIAADESYNYGDPDVCFDPRDGVSMTNDYYVAYAEGLSSYTTFREIKVAKYQYDDTDNSWSQPTGSPLTISNSGVTAKEVANPAIALDDDGNIVVLWQQRLTGGSYDWNVRGKVISTSGSTVLSEFTCAVSNTDQTIPDVAWIGTESSISSFVITYMQKSGATGDGAYMRRLRPDGSPTLSSAASIKLDTGTEVTAQPAIAASGDYFVCAMRIQDPTDQQSPYKVKAYHFDSPLGTTLPATWNTPEATASTSSYKYCADQVAVAGRPGDYYDLAFVAEVSSNRYTYAAIGEISETSLTITNWSDDSGDFECPAIALAPDNLVENPDYDDENRRLIIWVADDETNGFDIWGRFDPAHIPDVSASKGAARHRNPEEEVKAPTDFTLHHAYPNPFNPQTTVRFDLEKNAHVEMVVVDINGRFVAELVNEVRTPGTYSYLFDGSRLSSGVYFVQMKANGFTKVQKIILLK